MDITQFVVYSGQQASWGEITPELQIAAQEVLGIEERIRGNAQWRSDVFDPRDIADYVVIDANLDGRADGLARAYGREVIPIEGTSVEFGRLRPVGSLPREMQSELDTLLGARENRAFAFSLAEYGAAQRARNK